MQPEIIHRCRSCGVAIREAAMFCPECGQPLKGNEAPPREPVASETAKPATVESSTNRQAADPSGTVEKSRGKLQRASTVARDALEENVKRVDKIRHASAVVIGEASYDPSLRFVLVALIIFIIFVVLLVLSKVMG